jgi:photosystem II stability/assembly factor-like uncharacterized protein
MTTIRMALIAIVLAFATATASAQNSPTGSPTPPAAGKAQGADVLWYGEAPPGLFGGVTDMQLVAPGVGWAKRGERHYWTSDNGANWRDVTPPSSLISESQVTSESQSYENLDDVFFVDNHRGWALFSLHDDRANPNEQPKFDLAFTSDAGATWTKTHLAVPPAADWQGHEFEGDPELDKWAGQVVFADAQHGWIYINAGSLHSFLSLMLATSDGGRTWKQLRHAPAMVGPQAVMVTPSEGWLFGSAESLSQDGSIEGLYVTRDGGESWQLVYNMEDGFAAPKDIARTDWGPATCYVMGVPKFENSKHGFLEVTCSTLKHAHSHHTLVLFETDDSGRTWKPDRMVANINDNEVSRYGSSAVADSDWIFAASGGGHPVVLTKVGPGARIDANAGGAAYVKRYGEDMGKAIQYGEDTEYSAADQISFVTPAYGWVIVHHGKLMSTTDGGATWADITPGPQPHVINPLNEPARRE